MLESELEQIRGVGFAIDNEEFTIGVRAMAMPVRAGSAEVIAAANVVAPTSMVSGPQLVEDFGPHLLTAAGQISELLGYTMNEQDWQTADGGLADANGNI
jgi:IclR family pca regulon transcriptional regulator